MTQTVYPISLNAEDFDAAPRVGDLVRIPTATQFVAHAPQRMESVEVMVTSLEPLEGKPVACVVATQMVYGDGVFWHTDRTPL